MQIGTPITAQFKCTECGKGYQYEKWLQRHLRQKHQQNIADDVNIVDGDSSRSVPVSDSESNDHTECDEEEVGSSSDPQSKRVFSCSNCEDTFASKWDMNRHWFSVHASGDEEDASISSQEAVTGKLKARRRVLEDPRTEAMSSRFRCEDPHRNHNSNSGRRMSVGDESVDSAGSMEEKSNGSDAAMSAVHHQHELAAEYELFAGWRGNEEEIGNKQKSAGNQLRSLF